MLLSAKSLSNHTIEAIDGDIGRVNSFLFDDRNWILRYLVVDTGTWLPGKKVLIPPSVLGKPKGLRKIFPVELTKEQIKNSPDIDADKPVSRQQEIKLHKHYNWKPYWIVPYSPVAVPFEAVVEAQKAREDMKQSEDKTVENEDPHLRRTSEVMGYKIKAEDGQIGHVEDFIVDENDWVLRYMVVDTKNWLPGKKVITSPDWVKEIKWSDSEVVVDVKKDVIKDCPEFDPSAPVNREYEERLYDYYGRPRYWT
jgi:hypothetical protein